MALAAETHVDYSYHAPEIFVRANINGTQSLLEAWRLAGPDKRLLHVSTDEVYGEVMRGAAPETAALRPRNIYAATKVCGETLVRTTAEVFGLDAVVVRPCNIYGPRQQPEDLIPKTFARLLAGKKMTIHGDGRHVREYLYVKDAAFMLAEIFARGGRGEAYNLTSGDFHSTLDVVGTVARLLGRRLADVTVAVEDRPNPDRRYAGANRKAKKLLGRAWRRTPFAAGLAAMLADFRERPPHVAI
jgi:dTDP-glucose 4,6-dehydratase